MEKNAKGGKRKGRGRKGEAKGRRGHPKFLLGLKPNSLLGLYPWTTSRPLAIAPRMKFNGATIGYACMTFSAMMTLTFLYELDLNIPTM